MKGSVVQTMAAYIAQLETKVKKLDTAGAEQVARIQNENKQLVEENQTLRQENASLKHVLEEVTDVLSRFRNSASISTKSNVKSNPASNAPTRKTNLSSSVSSSFNLTSIQPIDASTPASTKRKASTSLEGEGDSAIEKEGTGVTTPEPTPVKRKRGRPRKKTKETPKPKKIKPRKGSAKIGELTVFFRPIYFNDKANWGNRRCYYVCRSEKDGAYYWKTHQELGLPMDQEPTPIGGPQTALPQDLSAPIDEKVYKTNINSSISKAEQEDLLAIADDYVPELHEETDTSSPEGA